MKLMMLMNKNEDVEVRKIDLDAEMSQEHKEMYVWIEELLAKHPDTWKQYKGDKEECDKIINMEIQELIDAKEKKAFHELEKEYIHCAAAFLNGYLKAKKYKEK